MQLSTYLRLSVLAVTAACGGQTPAAQQPTPGPTSVTQPCLATKVNIEKPAAGETDATTLTASGSVDKACAEAWVVVHPVGSTEYYVQAPPTVGNDGRWLATARLGEAGQGSGQTFELVAFANPEPKLAEGQVLTTWPNAQARSDVVAVARKAAVTVSPPAGPPAPTPQSNCKLSIIEPAHEAKVGDRPDVRVQAEKACTLTSVWVVVHPTAVSTYWVQPRPSERDGVWKTKIHIGRPGRDWNAKFEVKAFGNPSASLREGQELPYWPDAPFASELIEVTKGH
jgi:hypothetical protein